MKKLFDIIQLALQTPGFGFIVAFFMVVAMLQAAKLLSVAVAAVAYIVRMSKKIIFRFWGVGRVISISALALPIYLFSGKVSDAMQYIEQVYISPAYVNADTSYWAQSVYEAELKRNTSEAEFACVKSETERLARDLGSSPLAMYEVCYSECGMNPFSCNVDKRTGDTVAVGWIQFTRAGIKGVTVGGNQVTWPQVKGWTRSRNIAAMMEATRSYMVSRAAGKALPTSTDIYIAVFAPSFIGYEDSQTLYSISSWKQAYYDNQPLDGYAMVNNKIVHGTAFMDGKITVQDMRLHLALKKSNLLSKYQIQQQYE